MVCCFWLLFVRVPESKVYEQNMGVLWQSSVLNEGHASGIPEKESLCLEGHKTSARLQVGISRDYNLKTQWVTRKGTDMNRRPNCRIQRGKWGW